MASYKNSEVAWKTIEFPKLCNETGELGVVEFGQQIDFEVKRVFFLRNISKESTRGAHSHRSLKQLILCVNGSFSLILDAGNKVDTILMTPDSPAVFVDGRVWREMKHFSDGAVMLVLCDREYEFDEVIRDYDLFKENLEKEGLI
jgi:dTDP-4-dehydrorhamnose 3,5-epimerase-like enzyme